MSFEFLEKAIFIRVPRTGSTSIASLRNEVGFCVLGGARLGLWGRNVRLNTSSTLMERVEELLIENGKECSFKFAFVRNPYERAVSMWKHNSFKPQSFTSFCLKIYDHYIHNNQTLNLMQAWHTIPYYDILFDEKGVKHVDFIGRYENMQADFDKICERLGTKNIVVPKLNASIKTFAKISLSKLGHPPKGGHYSSHYSAETKDIVGEIYHKDIKKFKYRFEKR